MTPEKAPKGCRPALSRPAAPGKFPVPRSLFLRAGAGRWREGRKEGPELSTCAAPTIWEDLSLIMQRSGVQVLQPARIHGVGARPPLLRPATPSLRPGCRSGFLAVESLKIHQQT